MTIYIVPFKSPLDAVTELKREFGKQLVRVAPDSLTHKNKKTCTYINWGTGRWEGPGLHLALVNGTKVLNHPNAVRAAANKKTTFFTLDTKDVNTVEFTDNTDVAQKWLREGAVVFGRSLLTASGGRGIVQFEGKDTVITAKEACPLYTKYKKKMHEYRVHVFLGEVIDVQWKKRRADGVTETRIRNHDNGWVFCREDLVESKDLRQLAINAVKALGLDFGAVDIIWNQHEDRSYVLEVNTAPGLTGTTLEKYVAAIQKLF